MKRVQLICNTGPLIALSLLEVLDRVVDVFDLVTTETVVEEWRSRVGEVPPAVRIRPSPAPDRLLSAQLDPGEASVILLALENQPGNVLIDERRGRRIARRIYGLEVIGTARVLVELKNAGKLERVLPCLEFLIGNGYWLSQSVVDWTIRVAGETTE